MKILHVIPTVDLKRGGPSVAVRQMTEGLAAEGFDVTLATTTTGLTNAYDLGSRDVVVENGVRTKYFPAQISRGWMFSWRMTQWLFGHVGAFDLVHIHAVFPYPVWPACRASFRAGVPYVVRPAGTLDRYGMGLKSWKKIPYYQLMIKKNLRLAGAIQATSSHESDDLAALGFKKLITIPHGIQTQPIQARRRNLDGRPLQLLFLGRLDPIKGIPILLKAVAVIKRAGEAVSLDVAGAGSDDYTAFLRKEVDRLGLRDIVSFFGDVRNAEKRRLFQNADAFVLPSHHENFGIAVAEAMSYGLPVVISDQVALSKDVLRATAGFVVPTEDSETLAKMIRALFDNETRLELGRNARLLMAKEFNPNRQIQELVQLYGRLMSASLNKNGDNCAKRQNRTKFGEITK